ncbi:hypothetical protein KAI56_00400 [Candidatus Parcubacteria bacterium]|nr:hypothetical protein [Candidatus Parcubacteria bacterium]
MQKLNIPKTILTTTLFISFTLIMGLSVFGYLEIKKAGDLPVDFIEPVNPAEDNNNQEPVKQTESVELETYEAELFVEAKWGSGEGEVGIFVSGGDAGGAGPVYGPQSFDVDDKTGYLYLLDSVNERVLEYDGNGKYLRDFPIACGGTGDIRISPDGEFLYVFSGRCGAIYKYNVTGEFLESYSVVPDKNPGIGTDGMAFDENGNVMLDIEIEDYIKWSRFYQIGKNGDEWKENYYKGFISKDGKEYYNLSQINSRTRSVKVKNKKGELLRKFLVELPQPAYVYYKGSDDKKSIYLTVGFLEPITENGFNSDSFIWKYDKDGNLLMKINRFVPLKNSFEDDELLAIPAIYLYSDNFISFRVNGKGDVYWLATFKNKGLKIFKYSKIK